MGGWKRGSRRGRGEIKYKKLNHYVPQQKVSELKFKTEKLKITIEACYLEIRS